MATYFQAAEAVKVFTEYRRLTLAYWDTQPPDNRGWMGRDLPVPENEESLRIRQQIIQLYPLASTSANRMGVPVTGQSFPAPIVGGPVIPVNLLYGAFDRNQGHSQLPQQDVLDGIDRCLAQATTVKKHLFWHQLVNPVWWITEVIAYVLRIPFVILRRAGVPASVEESIWGNIVKAVFLLILILISIRWGLGLSAKDLLSFFK